MGRRVWCVRAYEEGGPVVRDPVRELVNPAIQRIEENHAAHPQSDAAPVEDRCWISGDTRGADLDTVAWLRRAEEQHLWYNT